MKDYVFIYVLLHKNRANVSETKHGLSLCRVNNSM